MSNNSFRSNLLNVLNSNIFIAISTISYFALYTSLVTCCDLNIINLGFQIKDSIIQSHVSIALITAASFATIALFGIAASAIYNNKTPQNEEQTPNYFKIGTFCFSAFLGIASALTMSALSNAGMIDLTYSFLDNGASCMLISLASGLSGILLICAFTGGIALAKNAVDKIQQNKHSGNNNTFDNI